MKEKILRFVDECIYQFLEKNVKIMPMRLVKLVANFYTDARIRKLYLRRMGVRMGENTFSNLGFVVVCGSQKINAVIGNNVSIAPNVVLIASSDANNGKVINRIPYVKNKLTFAEKIIIEDEVWIGANVTIMPGVRIGRCSVIGAGSVVTKEVSPYSVVAGVPARKIRDLSPKNY